MPGGLQLAAPTQVDRKYRALDSNAFLAKAQQSYVLNFKEGDDTWEFRQDECQVYGFSFAAFNLCLKNAADNVLQARQFRPQILSAQPSDMNRYRQLPGQNIIHSQMSQHQ